MNTDLCEKQAPTIPHCRHKYQSSSSSSSSSSGILNLSLLYVRNTQDIFKKWPSAQLAIVSPHLTNSAVSLVQGTESLVSTKKQICQQVSVKCRVEHEERGFVSCVRS